MERLKDKLTRVLVLGLLLSTILTFTQCKKESPAVQDDLTTYDESELVDSQSAVSNTTPIALTLSKITTDEGYAYRVSQNFGTTGDSNSQPSVSKLRVFEDGKELGPAHTLHADIRAKGNGRFSHWGNSLIFTASDNSDPRSNGRKYTVTTGGTPSVIPVEPGSPTTPTTPVTPPSAGTATLIGYAGVNGSTTGGKGGSEITVSSLQALISAVGSSGAKIIYVSGTIKASGVNKVYVTSNKSIIGLAGSSIEGVSFMLFGVNNIIFQNLVMKNYVTYSGVQVAESSHHIWVDHCEFSTDRNQGWEYWGKDVSITTQSDYVTLSWNKFHDNNLSVLISAGGAGHEADAGKLHVTLHHNFWYNISEREPMTRWGSVHLFNNYHLNNSGYSIGARSNVNLRTDNDYFSNCPVPISTSQAGEPAGTVTGANTNIYVNSGSPKITTAAGNWDPGYEFKSALHAAADVPAVVTKGAGATL